ncbi:hypothetical protein MUP07_00625 [Candidatus Bathyarchaeota archaeon]|nr:hypothetical protein [Candidatus Bathyarchaeota archaeon]
MSSDRKRIYGAKGKSTSTSIEFFNIKRRKKVSIPESDVEIIKKKGLLMYAATDPQDGMKLRKIKGRA